MTGLTHDAVARYERDGILFPIAVLSAAETARFRASFDALARQLGDPKAMDLGQCHLFYRWAYELATFPAVLDAVEAVIGSDILIHSSRIFPKYPRDRGVISWHQDGHYWELDEPRLVSAWIALTDSTPENGCMRVVPGSHRQRVPHQSRPAPDKILASGLEVAVEVDEGDALDVALCAGEMSLHHVNIIHGSKANPSDRERIGFAVRYVSPLARQAIEHHEVLLVRGRDTAHHYRHGTPPNEDGAAAIAAHAAFHAAPSPRRTATA